jgi:hypothetical protein
VSDSAGRPFEIVVEIDIDAAPRVVFAAVTTGNAGWLWPMDVEPRQGGTGPFGSVVTAWEPPHHFANRVEGDNGFYNELDELVEERADGTSHFRYAHSGVFYGDWDLQFTAVVEHTDFYLHTLRQYVEQFGGRIAHFAGVEGPDASHAADALGRVRTALGIFSSTRVGDQVVVQNGSAATVDYLAPHFIGIHTDDAMVRFFGRNAFGGTVGMSIHAFTSAEDAAALGGAWQSRLASLY